MAVATAATAAALLSVAASAGGSAGAVGEQTLTFFGDASQERVKLVDNQPKSPSPNPGSRRFRLSRGDEILLRTPEYDHQGGTRIGTLFAEGTIVKGHRFSDAVIQVQGTLKFGEDEIMVAGIVRDQVSNTEAVIGGTGAYEGARGSVTTTDVNGGQGSEDVVHLLP